MIVNTILVLIEYEQFRKYSMIVLKDAPDITILYVNELYIPKLINISILSCTKLDVECQKFLDLFKEHKYIRWLLLSLEYNIYYHECKLF
jgi:hypothetical protein